MIAAVAHELRVLTDVAAEQRLVVSILSPICSAREAREIIAQRCADVASANARLDSAVLTACDATVARKMGATLRQLALLVEDVRCAVHVAVSMVRARVLVNTGTIVRLLEYATAITDALQEQPAPAVATLRAVIPSLTAASGAHACVVAGCLVTQRVCCRCAANGHAATHQGGADHLGRRVCATKAVREL